MNWKLRRTITKISLMVITLSAFLAGFIFLLEGEWALSGLHFCLGIILVDYTVIKEREGKEK